MWAKQKRHGFTIVELLIVIIVIGILAALVLVAYSNVAQQARASTLQADLNQAAKQLSLDKERSGGSIFPVSLSAANGGNGITASNGNTFTYIGTPASAPTSYCLSNTNSSLNYFVQNNGSVQTGLCPTQGLIGWWKLNGDATDSSGNGFNGTYGGGTPTTTTGQNGSVTGALNFNGAPYITISAMTSALVSVPQFSMTGWVKPSNNPGGYNTYFGYRNDSANDFYVLQLTNSNNLECRFRNSAGNYFQPASPTATPSAWQFIALTYDGSTLRCYINATVATAPASGTFSAAASGMGIGVAGNGVNTLVGSLDDVRLYNRSLSAAEVQNLISLGAQ